MVDAVITPVVLDLATQSPAQTQPLGQTTVFDVAHFNNMVQNNNPTQMTTPSVSKKVEVAQSAMSRNTGLDGVVNMLKALNGSSDLIGTDALKVASPHKDLTPGEMLQITVKTHEFLFQSEMTANVANRTSDGIQQLFKQQS
ncbi:MAG: hypothetical protein JKY67_09525 [Pseudomonadales bacterium]|nr:hypothetical protein [Pseudomonadales bacterium]